MPGASSGSAAALVVGLISVILFFPFGPVLGPVAIGLGRKARRGTVRGDTGRGVATAGIVLGSIGLLTGAIVWIVASSCDCL